MPLGIKTSHRPSAPRGRRLGRSPCAVLLAAVLACCAGCGYQLASSTRGAESIGAIHIESPQPNSEFNRSLRDALRIRGVPVVATREQAGLVLRILDDTTGQRILSVSARNVPREYEVFYLVSFVLEMDQRPTSEAQQLIAVRNYTFDETQRLGKSAEEEALQRTLASELTVRMIHRIETVAGGEPGAMVLLPPSGN